MKINSDELSIHEIDSIRDAVKNHRSLDFSCYTLTNAQKLRFQEILKAFLDECNQHQLYNCMSYCLFELLDNASRANAKRIFFQERNLNINDENDYKAGMKEFKADIAANTKHYFEELNSGKLEVHLKLSTDSVIALTVSNNTRITEMEHKRILDKLEKTKHYQSMEDALLNDIDQTEGSGLGIISIVMMLKKLGLSADNLKFWTTDSETFASIEIPSESFMEI